MAFSLGNILKSAASTTVKALSPAYNAVAKVYDKVKSLVPNASTTPCGNVFPANSLFSVSAIPRTSDDQRSTGGLTSGISATATPSATSSSSLPSSSLCRVRLRSRLLRWGSRTSRLQQCHRRSINVFVAGVPSPSQRFRHRIQGRPL
jgi:hypothetical protein